MVHLALSAETEQASFDQANKEPKWNTSMEKRVKYYR